MAGWRNALSTIGLIVVLLLGFILLAAVSLVLTWFTIQLLGEVGVGELPGLACFCRSFVEA